MECLDKDVETGLLKHQQLQVGKHQWYFYTLGNGPHCLIALHGFGEAGKAFAGWEQALGEDCTLIAIDLPFHGRATEWSRSNFDADELVQLIDHLPSTLQCKKYSLIGHSLGGRIVQHIWPRLQRTPASVWLLAPDGLATRRLGLLKHVPAGTRRWISRRFNEKAAFWLRWTTRLNKMGLIDAFSHRYMRYHLADQKRRRRLMGVWTSLKSFPLDKVRLLKSAHQADAPIHMVIGRMDELIDWKSLENWLAQWPKEQLHLFDNLGHELLTPEVMQLIVENLRQPPAN